MKPEDALKRKTTRKENTKRRAALCKKVYELKLIPGKGALAHLRRLFLESKWLYNYVLGKDEIFTFNSKNTSIQRKNKDKVFEDVVLTIPAQIRQAVVERLKQSVINLSKTKKSGRRVGRLRFKPSLSSIDLPQIGVTFSYENGRLKLQKLKQTIYLRGLDQIPEGAEFASAKLIQKPSGYYLKQLVYLPKEVDNAKQDAVGIDFGVKTHITLDTGEEFNCLIKEPRRIKRLQRQIARKPKGSRNRYKARHKLSRAYERLTNKKNDVANKLVSVLKNTYKLIGIQDDNLSGWKILYGKQIHHSILGRVKNKLKNLEKTHVVPRFAPTTQLCPHCLTLTKHTRDMRDFKCSKCGFAAPRDQKAALVIKLMAQGLLNYHLKPQICAERAKLTPGEQVASAVRENCKLLVMNQEAPPFRVG